MFGVIFNRDRRPVDPRSLVAAGLDVVVIEGSSHVALVCSKPGPLRALGEEAGIRELGGKYWLVGRVRLDARSELVSRLSAHIPRSPADIPDAQLCLHAYAVWGESFVDRLAGDFCFVVWDQERQRLIGVRDQLGIRSLFHAETAGSFVVSDSLDWIASRPSVARGLDDVWIADFLCVGHSLDFERTVYRDIRRLAPAHVLTFSESGKAVRRYWRLDIGEPIHFRDRRLYAERFLDLLSKSVADRLPPGKVGISMSGGLDSTTLADRAVHVTGDPSRVVAECVHFDKLFSDDETHFSTLVAQRLGIELRLRAVDDHTYDPQWRSRSIVTPEPSSLMIHAHMDREVARERAARAQVWFYGEGPDNALAFERGDYLSWLLGRREWLRLGEAGLLYLRAMGLSGLRAALRRHTTRRLVDSDSIDVPPWLDQSLAGRLGLEDRLRGTGRRGGVGAGLAPPHPWHPGAVAWFNDPIWSAVFGDYEFEESLAPLVLRHPFLDLQVLQFMLSVPTVPWARDKLLIREAMRGRLPDEVLARKKAAITQVAVTSPVRRHGLPALSPNSRLEGYVDVRRLPSGTPSGHLLRQALAVHILDHWLTERKP